jgi:hypothetical protein
LDHMVSELEMKTRRGSRKDARNGEVKADGKKDQPLQALTYSARLIHRPGEINPSKAWEILWDFG